MQMRSLRRFRRRFATIAIATGMAVIPASAAHADFSVNNPLLVALNAQAGGATANFAFTGAGSNVTVAMRYDRANPGADPGVGFMVYQDANIVVNEPAASGSRGAVAYTFFASPGLHYG